MSLEPAFRTKKVHCLPSKLGVVIPNNGNDHIRWLPDICSSFFTFLAMDKYLKYFSVFNSNSWIQIIIYITRDICLEGLIFYLRFVSIGIRASSCSVVKMQLPISALQTTQYTSFFSDHYKLHKSNKWAWDLLLQTTFPSCRQTSTNTRLK